MFSVAFHLVATSSVTLTSQITTSDRHQDMDNIHDTEDTAMKITQDSGNFINFNSF
jgi:hypothetical protein